MAHRPPVSLSLFDPTGPVTPRSGLTRYQRGGLVLLLVAAVLFGGLVELRSAFLHRRMGDLDVFLRAAWAVRAGQDVYTATDGNGFHYHYPPLFAILLTPLADPPPGCEGSWTLPYAVTVGLWYIGNLLCLAVAVHWLAGVLEGTPPLVGLSAHVPGGRGWWALRVVPILVCLAPIAHTLVRGQVSLLLLLLLSGMVRALAQGRRGQAGWWLAAAICLKVIPAFLLLYPLYRRDGRCLAGCAGGLFVGLLLIPAAVFGPARTLASYMEWTRVLVCPGLGAGTDPARAKELLEATATDSQSFQAVVHNTLYPVRETRPVTVSGLVRCTHWLAGAVLTGVALVACRYRSSGRPWSGMDTVLLLGLLVVLMLLLSPVCHLHYFCLCVPLVMGLLVAKREWAGGGQRGAKGLTLLLLVYGLANVLPHLPGMELLRDLGLALYAALALWLAGSLLVSRRRDGTGQPLVVPQIRAWRAAA